jgi:hypothetical protein
MLVSCSSSLTQPRISSSTGSQRLPRRAVALRAFRSDRLDDDADELVGQQLHTAASDQPGRDRGLDAAAGGLAVHPSPLTDRATRPPHRSPSDAKPLEPRALQPPGMPSTTPRSIDLDESQTAGLDHCGRHAAGGPMTGKSGGPMTVAKLGSNRSHDPGRRHPAERAHSRYQRRSRRMSVIRNDLLGLTSLLVMVAV